MNDAPSVTSGASESADENTTGTVYTAAGADPDGDALAWSISGTDAALFNIDSSTGALSFNTAPDYESPTDNDGNNAYEITIQASDGSLTATKNTTITVTNVNDAPIISNSTKNGTEDTELTFAETDFSGSTSFTWQASDGTAYSASATMTLSIANVNEAPTVHKNAGKTVLEGSSGTAIGQSDLEATDTDTAASSLTYTLTAVPTNGTLKKERRGACGEQHVHAGRYKQRLYCLHA